MKLFSFAHATHPQWRLCAGLVIAQLKAQMAMPAHAAQPSLGLVYFTDHYAASAQDLLNLLREELPGVKDWAGTVGVGIASNNVEYFDEPAMAVMLLDLPHESYRIFSGVAPLSSSADFLPHSALVHADGRTPDLAELLRELAGRLGSGYLFGGLAASRQAAPQVAWRGSDGKRSPSAGVFEGGLSGVAFSADVSIVSRVTQGCQPIRLADGSTAKTHRITKSDGHVVIELDGEPALDVLLDELAVSLSEPQRATQSLRQTFVGLSLPAERSNRHRHLGAETRIRHLVGLDPLRRGVAVADYAPEGSELVFCERNAQAARRDLMRIAAEIRDELEPEDAFELSSSQGDNAINSVAVSADSIPAMGLKDSKTILGAIYVSCAGRGGPHFGGESAELQILRHALGDVPLVGFFAGGEIAHQNVYGYTGVLTVFTADALV